MQPAHQQIKIAVKQLAEQGERCSVETAAALDHFKTRSAVAQGHKGVTRKCDLFQKPPKAEDFLSFFQC